MAICSELAVKMPPGGTAAYHGCHYFLLPVDNFGTVVGENPTPYGILALWAVNSLSIVYWAVIRWPIKPVVSTFHSLSEQSSCFEKFHELFYNTYHGKLDDPGLYFQKKIGQECPSLSNFQSDTLLFLSYFSRIHKTDRRFCLSFVSFSTQTCFAAKIDLQRPRSGPIGCITGIPVPNNPWCNILGR